MMTQTSEIAIKALVQLALLHAEDPVTPREIAGALDCSQTYLAKILGQLVKAGILRSVRGAQGGVRLAKSPGEITLLEIVEACQGLLIGNYCRAIGDAEGPVCGFHEAMREVHLASRAAMERWTLAMLAARPLPTGPLAGNPQCRMDFARGLCAGATGGGCPAEGRGGGGM